MDNIGDYLIPFIGVLLFSFLFLMDYYDALFVSNISLDILRDKKHPEYKKHKKRAKDAEMKLLNSCRSTLKSAPSPDLFKNSSCMKLCKLYNN